MKYELETLDQLILELEEYSSLVKVNHNFFDDFTDRLELEIQRIKKDFFRIAFSDLDDNKIARHFRDHQKQLVKKLNFIQKQLNEEAQIDTVLFNNIVSQTGYLLNELINFLEDNFEHHLDQDSYARNTHCLSVCAMIQDSIPVIESNLQLLDLDDDLKEILLLPLTRLSIESKYTVRQLDYFTTYARCLESMKPEPSEHDMITLMANLIRLNFNSYKLISHFISFIKEDYQDLDSLSDQLQRLAWYSKTVCQMFSDPTLQYIPTRQSLKDALFEWIEKEYAYLGRTGQTSLNLLSDIRHESPIPSKVNVSLSVAKLALFVRLLVDAKVIQNSNKTEVLQIISQFVCSKNAENITIDSFRKHFYNISPGTKVALEEVLENLLNNLRKH